MGNWDDATEGWRSKGTEVRCPKCGEMGTQIETTIFGRTRLTYFCNTCAHDWKHKTYDQHQIEAPLITCQSCGKAWYMTVPQQPCDECRRSAPAAP